MGEERKILILFKSIKEKFKMLLKGIKICEELDTVESNIDTVSQMSTEELNEISDKVFNQPKTTIKTREELMALVDSYLNIGHQLSHKCEREKIDQYIDMMAPISDSEANDAIKQAFQQIEQEESSRMGKRFMTRIHFMDVINAIMYDAIGQYDYDYLRINRKIEVKYGNVDVYELMKRCDDEATQDDVDSSLILCCDEFEILTPKFLKQYTKALFDGVKLTNVKIRDWDDISFTVKFTEPRFYYWWDKLIQKIHSKAEC